MRVLVAEDEPMLAEAIQSGLRQAAIAADVVHDGNAAVRQLSTTAYDAVVLDRDLPGKHGDEVCRVVVAAHPECRVLMLTAARTLGDKLSGLGLGADDYLTKPFEFPELVARLRALNRRRSSTLPPVLTHADIRLDAFRHEVHRGGRLVSLTRKEFAVLELLLRHHGGIVSGEELLDKAWDVNTDPFTNAVRITISTLRAKLGEPGVIETVTGVGYRMAAERG